MLPVFDDITWYYMLSFNFQLSVSDEYPKQTFTWYPTTSKNAFFTSYNEYVH